MKSWWEEELKGTLYELFPTSRPDVPSAVQIWQRIAPVIFSSTSKITDEKEHWEAVENIVLKLTGIKTLPNSQSDISGFLQTIYEHRFLFKPEKIEHCLPFVSKFCPTPALDFFVYDFPKAIANSILAVQTMLHLHRINDPQWISFTKEHGAIGRLVDLYLPFLTPLIGRFDPKYWNFRVEMCDLLCSLIIENQDTIDLLDEFLVSLNKQITKIITDAPPQFAVCFLRCCIQINEIAIPRVKTETAVSKRLLGLIRAAPSDNIAHAPLVFFVMKFAASGILTYDQIAAVLVQQEVTSSYDLEILATLAVKPKSNAVMRVLKFISKQLVTSTLHSRCCIMLLLKILRKETEKEPMNWFKRFIRRLTFLIGLATTKGRYKGKVGRVIESLYMMNTSGIQWLSAAVRGEVAGLVAIGDCPQFLTSMFAIRNDTEISPDWKREYQTFKDAHSLALKQYPFHVVGYEFCEPEKEKPKGKKKSAAKKTVAVKIGSDTVKRVVVKKKARPKWES